MLTHLPKFTHFSVYEKWQQGGAWEDTYIESVVARLPTHSGMSGEEEMAVLCRP